MYGVVWWGEREWFMSCGERQIRRGKSSGEQVDVGSLIASQAHGNVSFWATVGTHIWVHGPDAAVVCVDVPGS